MSIRSRFGDSFSSLYWAVAPVRRKLRLAWYRAEWEAMAFALFAGLVVTGFAFGLHAATVYQDAQREAALQARAQEVNCLARNVYFEARGEPAAGQYAVAEVTMNRMQAERYPSSVCQVVHQKNWDAIRKRYVAAFSWTELGDLPAPSGEEWTRAREIAEQVYGGERPEKLHGALFYHASRIKPSWAKRRKLVARIGRHDFYR